MANVDTDIMLWRKKHSDSKLKFSETDNIRTLEFLIADIFVKFARRVFQQRIGIAVCTNWSTLLTDLFLYSHEAEFMQGPLKKNED